MKSKIIPLILAATVCVGLLTGCQSSELNSFSEDMAKESAAPEATENTQTTRDYTPCYESYDPDEVMLTINGIDVTWEELFYWYVYEVSNLESYFGDISDWDAKCSFDPETTYREYVMQNTLDIVKNYCSIESKANDLGVTLTEEDKTELQTNWEANVQSYGNGDEKAFIDYLKKAYLTKEMYDHINEVKLLYDRMLENMFGSSGEKISEKEVVQKATDLGYVRAKHILISTKDDTNTALPADQLAVKKALAESLIKELSGITDKTALEKRFDEMIAENGADPGMQIYTDGYTFIPGSGTMDTTFESAITSLGDYEVSGVVETSFGYHIILRLPLSASSAVILSNDNSLNTLAFYIAQDMFNSETENWTNESTVKLSKTYEKMDIGDVFSKATTVPAEGN